MDTASQGDERKMTKANPVWNERTKETGTEPGEMVLMKIVSHLYNQRYLIVLKLRTMLQKLTKANGERGVPLQGELTKEPTQDLISGAKAQRTTIFDEGQWRDADQETEDSKATLNQAEPMTGGEGTLTITRKEQEADCLTYHRLWQEGIKIVVFDKQEARRWREHGQEKEMPKPKPEFEDGDSEVEIATGCNPRMPAEEIDPGKLINSNAATMVKKEYASDGENGETDHRRVVSSVGRIVDSSRLHAPTLLAIKSLLQKPVRTGLEWIRPQRCNLDKESATSVRQEIKLDPHDDPEMPRSRHPFKRLKRDRRDANLTLEDIRLHDQDDTA